MVEQVGASPWNSWTSSAGLKVARRSGEWGEGRLEDAVGELAEEHAGAVGDGGGGTADG